MYYELAKQLKDAGFPQERKEVLGEHYSHKQLRKEYWKGKEACIVPTLEELIDACGERFFKIMHIIVETEMNWQAGGFDESGVQYSTTGKTPSEAVANLWLELNK